MVSQNDSIPGLLQFSVDYLLLWSCHECSTNVISLIFARILWFWALLLHL